MTLSKDSETFTYSCIFMSRTKALEHLGIINNYTKYNFIVFNRGLDISND